VLNGTGVYCTVMCVGDKVYELEALGRAHTLATPH